VENSIELASASQLVSSETIASVVASGALPDGEYVAKIHGVDHYTGDVGKLTLDIELRVVDGEHAGRTVFETLTLDIAKPDPLRGPWYRLGVIATAAGVPTPMSDPRRQLREGRALRVTVEGGSAKRYAPIAASAPLPLQIAPAPVVAALPAIVEVETPAPVVTVPEFTLRLPGILSDIAGAISETAPLPQPQLSGLAALSFAATVMGQIYVGPSGLATNLYLLGIAPSGAGKDRPQKALAAALDACALSSLICDEPASGSALLTRLGDTPNTLMLVDEFGKFARALFEQRAGAHQREIATHFLKLSGEPQAVYVARMYADPSARKTRPVRYPCLNVLAATTPSTYFSCLSREQVEDGLLGRFITLEAPGGLPAPNPDRGAFVMPQTAVEWARQVRARQPIDSAMLHGPFNPWRIAFADDRAAGVLSDLEADSRRRWQTEIDAGSGLEAMTRRWAEWGIKLATVGAAAVDPVEPRIRRDVAEWAAQFARYAGERAIDAVARHVADSQHDRNVKDCLAALERAGAKGLTEGQRCRNVGAFKRLTPRERNDVIAQLVESGAAARIGNLLMLTRYAPGGIGAAK